MDSSVALQKLSGSLPAEHLQSLREIENNYWWYVARVYWATQMLGQAFRTQTERPHTYADLGAGTGGFAKALQSTFQFQRSALVDLNTQALEPCPAPFELLERNLGGTFSLPFQPDVITCMDVIEHLPDDRKFLSQIRELMPDSGTLLLSVPAMPQFYSEWDRQLGHFRRYTRAALCQKLRGAGFEIKAAHYLWCWIAPVILIRKFFGKRYRGKTTFEKVPSWLNATLIQGSKWDWAISRRIGSCLPFGTSLMVLATKANSHDAN